ncbi:hypothetical protein JOD54_006037 [Actinokineospora baliensis]|uniref:hypothetical protein n=1 Tax=Actinokineospora baliensis TaxID=547056 RepID=UPI00195A4C16|nr:hypothetical protein [Actinokineospora baliensis]MBM7775833.1 hypothetical protein [Actinokineospora baliensis]
MKMSAMTKVLVAAGALVMLSACGKAANGAPGGGGPTIPAQPTTTERVGPPLNTEFDLERGESTALSDSDVLIAFREVSQDSRCKPGQACVWEGDATVELTLAGSAVQVHTNKQFPMEAEAGGYKVSLVKLDVPGAVATLVVRKA